MFSLRSSLSLAGAHFFNILIEFAYTHHIPPDVRCDKESLCWLLTVADRFEATQCIQKCAKELTSSPTTLEDAVMYLTLPETVKRHPALREAMDSVCDLTGWSFEEVATCENFCAMPESSMVIAVSMLRHGEDVETVFRLILQWFRNRGPERWSAFEGLLSLLGFWRMSPSFIRDEVEACPELRSPEGRTLVAEVKALEDPWEKIKADALQELAEVQGAAGAVAGAAAPVVLDPRMTSLMVLGWVTGFVVPLVFAVRAHNHKHQDLAGILAFLATFQILPAGGVLVGMTIGTLFGLKLGK